MTDWRAVGIGFVVGVITGLIAFAVPLIGHIGAGLIGGFAAGYVACSDGRDGIGRGAWHGLLAGAIGGIVLAVVFAVLVLFVGVLAGGPAGVLGGASVFVGGVLIAFVLALDSAVGGAIGALVA